MIAGTVKKPELPNEPLLSLVIESLNLSSHDAFTQINTIFQYQAQSGLRLYVPRGLRFTAQFGVEVEPVDSLDGGDTKLLSCGNVRYFNSSETDIQIYHSVLLNTGAILVDEVVFQENHYRPVSECQTFLEPLSIGPNGLFAKRDELELFIEQGPKALPSYLNPNSDYYAPELALAIDLHRELTEGSLQNSSLNMEDRVHSWINRHRSDLQNPSGALLKRMAAIINPVKKKGNPFNR